MQKLRVMTQEFFKNRYTVRQYSDKSIDEALLMDMLDAASHAPNTGNMQWYSAIVTTDPANKKKLAPAHFNQPQVEGSAAVVTFCIDLNRFEAWCRLRNAEPGFSNFQSFVAAIIDTSLVAQQFCTIAEMNGLGTCYLGTTTYNAPQIAEALALPERVVPVTTITVGYPFAGTVIWPTWRLPVEAWVHKEKYSEPSKDEIAEWYSGIENDPSSAKFIEENSKETLAQVFTDVRYPRESAEYFSEVYADLLKRNKFL